MLKIRNKKELKIIRARLRKNMPAPELVLWQQLRNNSLGVKFRRQFSVENIVMDFYSPEVKLDIEVDGESHFEDSRARYQDKMRDQSLAKPGIRVLRFTNNDVMRNLEGVIDTIIKYSTPSLSPPYHGGENKRGNHAGERENN